MPKVIVFGNTLQNTMGLIRSIGLDGGKVDLLLEPIKKSRCFVRFSKYVNKVTYLSHIEDAIAVLLREYGSESVKPVVLCGSDPTISLLDANYNRLKDKFVIFNANGEEGRINKYLNKTATFELAEKCGLNLIKTWKVKGGDILPNDIAFPCFVKGENSVVSGKWDIKVCNTRDEVIGFLREGVDYLIQEFIRKDAEVSLTGLSWNHGADVLIPGVIKKVREDLIRMGEFMRLDDTDKYPMINFEGIRKMIAAIGYEGIFSVDLLIKGTCAYFLEVNLRNDGLAYMYTAAGVNFPALWLKYVNGLLTTEDISALSLRTPFYVMHENDMYNIIEGKVTIWQWIKDLHRTNAFFVLDFSDPMPFIYSTWIHAKQACKKVLRAIR